MNKNPSTTILLGALGLSALVSLILCFLFIQYTRELRSLQGPASQAAMKLNLVNALGNDAREYSKKNPSIDPILEAVNLKPKSVTPAKPTK